MRPVHNFCSRCATPFAADASLPRTCGNCGQVVYENPIPVAVVLQPVGRGLLLGQRAIPPFVGGWALIGGFMELGESWQQAGARETFEETGLEIDPSGLRPLAAAGTEALFSTPNGNLLAFMEAAPLPEERVAALVASFAPTKETLALRIALEPEDLCFSAHAAAMRAWFAARA